MKRLYTVIALATILLTVVGLFNLPRDQPDDTISFSYCNSSGGPVLFDLESVSSESTIKKGKDNVFVFKGNALKEQYIKYSKSTAKIGLFGKTFETQVNQTVEPGPFEDKLPVSLKGSIKGTCKLTIRYYDENNNEVACNKLTFKVK